MEGQLIDLVLQIATLALGGGLGAAILSYVRNRRKDSLDAYSDLYEKLSARVVHLENELETERERTTALRQRVSDLEREIDLTRQRLKESQK